MQILHALFISITSSYYCSVNVAGSPSAAFGVIHRWKSPGSAEKVYANLQKPQRDVH